MNTFRVCADSKQSSSLLSYLAMGFSIGNGFFRPIWGVLFDLFGFKKPWILLNVISFIISSSIYFVIDYTVIFSIMILFGGVIEGGMFSLLPSFVEKVFGIKLSSEVYGMAFFSFGISGLIGPLIIHFSPGLGGDDDTTGICIAYLVGSGLTLISLVICIFTTEEKIKYK